MDYKYFDETADIARHYCVGFDATSPSASERRRSVVSEHRTLAEPSIFSETVKTLLNTSDPFVSSHGPDTALDYSPYPLQLSPGNQSSASPHFSHYSHSSQGSRDFVDPINGELPNLDEHEACLMRYFVVELAPWVCTRTFRDTQLIFYSSIFAMETDILLAQCLCEPELVPLCSVPFLPPLPDT